MIKGKSITLVRENNVDCKVDYRKIDALNVSSIKCFDSDPLKFYKEFILKQKRKEGTKSVSLIIGDLVDFYLLDCRGDEEVFQNRFDEKFALFEGVKGTGQVYLLADTLYEITQGSLNSKGEVVRSFDDRFKEAYNKMIEMGKYGKKTIDKVLEDFNDNGKDYFEKLLDNNCKTVVDISLVDKSKRVASGLVNDTFTKDLFVEDGMNYLPKFPIEWNYTTKGGKVIKCKSEADLIKIDHTAKKIYLYDVKTTYDNEDFAFNYLKYRYDLQAAFYYMAVQFWKNEEDMENYEIVPMEFIVGDTSMNNRRPARYVTTSEDLFNALNGFSIRGHYYKGLHELVEEISWAEDNDMWNCSKVLCDNNGIMQLNLQYE